MDIRRSIIFVGLAIVSYMLILAWNDDYGQVPQPSVVQTESQKSAPIGIDSEAQTPGLESQELTVPEAKPAASSSSPNQPVTIGAQTIRIATDVLELVIDLTGGNIVSAKMPHYKATLGSDQPLALLENSATRYYVVKSGLIGKDGFDSAKNGTLPTYRAEQAEYSLTVLVLFYVKG